VSNSSLFTPALLKKHQSETIISDWRSQLWIVRSLRCLKTAALSVRRSAIYDASQFVAKRSCSGDSPTAELRHQSDYWLRMNGLTKTSFTTRPCVNDQHVNRYSRCLCSPGLKVFFKGCWISQFFTLSLCNKIMMTARDTRVKSETCCHDFYIVYRKFLTVTNYYKVCNVFITWRD